MLSGLVKTIRESVVGTYPSCHINSRTEQRREEVRALREKRRRNRISEDIIVDYENSGSDEETPAQLEEALNTSYNICDYLQSRESSLRNRRSVNVEATLRHTLNLNLLCEKKIFLGYVNKVMCSQWLTHRHVIFGTFCKKLLVYDVKTNRLDNIALLSNTQANQFSRDNCIYAIEINPSRTYLATCGENSSQVAIYRLPTLDPVCVGEHAHHGCIASLCWLDDVFLVSGSMDSRIAFWRVRESDMQLIRPDAKDALPAVSTIQPLRVKKVQKSRRLCDLCYNKELKEIVAVSFNAYIHIFLAYTFRQKVSRQLLNCEDPVSIAYHSGGLYAIASRNCIMLLDARTLQLVKRISKQNGGCGIRSISIEGDLLTFGTGVGVMLFFDLRTCRYLRKNFTDRFTVGLRVSTGTLYSGPESSGFKQIVDVPIFTHCYDSACMRLFAGGGIESNSGVSNCASIWY